MESIYYVMAWACHRKCKHCYEDRFRPYVRGELEAVVQEAERNFPRIRRQLPERFTYRDLDDPSRMARFLRRRARDPFRRESLLDPVRERVTYKVVEATAREVRGAGRREGGRADDRRHPDRCDRRRPPATRRLDDLGGERRRLSRRPRRSCETAGVHGQIDRAVRAARDAPQRVVGDHAQLARGDRAGVQLLRRHAGLLDRQAVAARPRVAEQLVAGDGGGQLLQSLVGRTQFSAPSINGSEVSIEPDGAVYPCCIKTKLPIGSLLEDGLIDILESLAGVPAYEAITMGHPERMGVAHGWDEEEFLAQSRTSTPNGTPYQNLCIGCDRFHEQLLGPVLAAARARRRAAKGIVETVEPSRKIIALMPNGD
jgi:hypothetical protein